MKLSGMVGLIIVISIVFLSVGLLIDSFETNYIDTNISSSDTINQSLKDNLVSVSQINETFNPLVEDVGTIQQEEGWFMTAVVGGIMLPKIFVNFIVTLLKIVGLSQQQTFTILKFIGIPIIIISIVSISIIIWFIFKIIEQLRGYPA